MKNIEIKSLLYCFIISIIIPENTLAQTTDEEYGQQSIEESLTPIHPGIPGVQEFWNLKSRMFKYAPSFDNSNKSWLFSESREYRYTAFSFTDKQDYVFTAQTPYESLSPIWDKIPYGRVYLKVEGISSNGTDIDLAGSRMFYKAPVFSPPYPEANKSYADALEKGLIYFYNQKHIKDWYFTKKPDHDEYYLYCYPAKIVGSVVYGMLMYHTYFPENDTALVIARNAADYLIETAEPAGAPLEYLPQVYEGNDLTAGRFGKEIIMMEPAVTGTIFLELYDVTNEPEYLQAAIKIADTYAKNQLPSGTWYIRIKKETGEPASQNLCIPIGIVDFISILTDKYHQEQYRGMIQPAINWILNNPVKTYDWTGQFEDYAAASPYENLTKYEAAWFVQYLLENKKEDSLYVPIAKELLAFCEDQFIFWETPEIYDSWGTLANRWVVPCTAEQYQGYVPVDASSDHMVFTFLKAYESLGDPIYREKAIALANAIVNIQLEDGRIPTFLTPTLPEFWHNCMVASLMMLEKMTTLE